VKEREVQAGRSFVADDQPAEGAVPRHCSLDDPAAAIATQFPTVLGLGPDAIDAVRADQLDTATCKRTSKRIGVVGTVSSESHHPATWTPTTPSGNCDRRQSRLGEFHFRRRGRCDGNSQRNTLAVCHHHALRALAPPGFPDVWAPFFAEANVASMNASSQSMRPRASSCPKNARQTRSHTPRSSQAWSRLQHVEGLGYSEGRSRHRAPVFNTQRIPSRTSRWATHGRPPRGLDRARGNNGSIFDHCRSVSRIPRRGTATTSAPTSGRPTRDRTGV